MNPFFDDIVTLVHSLHLNGYTNYFKINARHLTCLESGLNYEAEQVRMHFYKKKLDKISKEERIIFALECVDGRKGILDIDASNSNPIELLEFIDKVKIKIISTLGAV